MSTQKNSKQGFTLIELMVVIVIIGILAAIAIPKLFGMSAKAKASEVGPAAGTWSKLQLAYIMETEEVGTFKEIAYSMPGNNGQTTNFDYTGEENTAGAWEAKLTKTLTKECGANKIWSATYVADANDPPGEPNTLTVDEDCENLTTNFCKLRAGGCTAAP
jgi:prepilin-type N-terminal cleavage/methylation domain-containing protein